MSDEEKKPEAPEWKYKEGFAINDQMKEVIKLAIQLTQAEIDQYRAKLRKLTYGS